MAENLDPMSPEDKMKFRRASFIAPKLYPGPVGELCAREILDWAEFGYRMDNSGLVHRLVETILGTKLNEETP
jgi:hypothetical protein